MSETYQVDQPWVCITYLMTDAEADANQGESRAQFDCCICGEKEVVNFILPGADDPCWKTVDPEKGLPEAHRLLTRFKLAHLHPDRKGQPMMMWAKPLRNLAALGGVIDLEQLKARLEQDLSQYGQEN